MARDHRATACDLHGIRICRRPTREPGSFPFHTPSATADRRWSSIWRASSRSRSWTGRRGSSAIETGQISGPGPPVPAPLSPTGRQVSNQYQPTGNLARFSTISPAARQWRASATSRTFAYANAMHFPPQAHTLRWMAHTIRHRHFAGGRARSPEFCGYDPVIHILITIMCPSSIMPTLSHRIFVRVHTWFSRGR